jgi:hypothetical protein
VEINSQRQAFGHDPIDMAVWRRVEQMATGHTDYAHKVAIYAAELSQGILDVKP